MQKLLSVCWMCKHSGRVRFITMSKHFHITHYHLIHCYFKKQSYSQCRILYRFIRKCVCYILDLVYVNWWSLRCIHDTLIKTPFWSSPPGKCIQFPFCSNIFCLLHHVAENPSWNCYFSVWCFSAWLTLLLCVTLSCCVPLSSHKLICQHIVMCQVWKHEAWEDMYENNRGPRGTLTHPSINCTDCCLQPDIMKERAGAQPANNMQME